VITWVRSLLPPRYFAYGPRLGRALREAEGSRLELDRGLGLDATTSVQRASFPEAFRFGWLAREGKGCAVPAGAGGLGRQRLKGITARRRHTGAEALSD